MLGKKRIGNHQCKFFSKLLTDQDLHKFFSAVGAGNAGTENLWGQRRFKPCVIPL